MTTPIVAEEYPPLDRALLLGVLQRNGVEFVLVGGLAAQAHGAKRTTLDADICPRWNAANLARLSDALKDLEARLRIGEGSVETLDLDINARFIDAMEIGAWRTTAGDVDVLLGIPSTSRFELARYEQLAEDAVELEIDSLRVQVASLGDIIRSKEISDRPKDRAALDELRTLRDLEEAG